MEGFWQEEHSCVHVVRAKVGRQAQKARDYPECSSRFAAARLAEKPLALPAGS
jgi:hypothetical protein